MIMLQRKIARKNKGHGQQCPLLRFKTSRSGTLSAEGKDALRAIRQQSQ